MRIALLALSAPQRASEAALAATRAGMEVVDFYENEPIATHPAADAYVLLAHADATWADAAAPVLIAFLQTQHIQGKPILGLGYGSAKLLAESGLVPGLFKNQVGLSVVKTAPIHRTTTAAWIRLSADYQLNVFTRTISPQLCLPVCLPLPATFVIPPGLRAEIEAQGLNVFLYCDAAGNLLTDGHSIAAIANKTGNVLAMLPELEQASTCDLLFQSLHKHLASGQLEPVEPLYYWPRR